METVPFTNDQYKAIKINDINYIENILSKEMEISLPNKIIKIPSGYYATITLMTEKHAIKIYYFNNEIDLYHKDLKLFEQDNIQKIILFRRCFRRGWCSPLLKKPFLRMPRRGL